jgi:hypothetical protein
MKLTITLQISSCKSNARRLGFGSSKLIPSAENLKPNLTSLPESSGATNKMPSLSKNLPKRTNPFDKLEQLELLGNGSYGSVVRVKSRSDGR